MEAAVKNSREIQTTGKQKPCEVIQYQTAYNEEQFKMHSMPGNRT